MATRLRKVEVTVTPQKSNSALSTKSLLECGIFPLFDPQKFKNKTEDSTRRPSKAVFVKGDRTSKSIDAMSLASTAATKINMLNPSTASIGKRRSPLYLKFSNLVIRTASTGSNITPILICFAFSPYS